MINAKLALHKICEKIESTQVVSSREFELLAQVIADAIEDDKKVNLNTVSIELDGVVKKILRKLPNDVFHSITNEREKIDTNALLVLLGSLSFAQTISIRASAKLVDDQFKTALMEASNYDLLKHLLEKNLSNIDLAKSSKKTPETVCRKVSTLVKLGAIDFRTEGRNRVNFLTPVAKRILEQEIDATYAKSGLPQEVKDIMGLRINKTEKQTQIQPDFA